jgi:hypothetical protein
MSRVLTYTHFYSLTIQFHWPYSLNFSVLDRLFLLFLTFRAVTTFAEDVYHDLKVVIERDDTDVPQLMMKTEVGLNNFAYKVGFNRTLSVPIHFAMVKGNIGVVIGVDVQPLLLVVRILLEDV